MQLNLYNKAYADYFSDAANQKQIQQAVKFLEDVKNIFFIGNGGSNAICAHMMEDYAKMGGFRTFSFTDAAMITCFANDYGYENAIMEWLKIYFDKGDLLVAISSSGKSRNILNAAAFAGEKGGKIITLSGFKKDNPLKSEGEINFHVPVENFGVVECFHQVILHVILDEICANK